MELWEIALLTLLAAALVVVFLGAHYLDARLGGWRNLAEKYPGLPKLPASGQLVNFQTIRLDNGGVRYPSAVRVTICQEGLQLDLQAVAMRTFFPPLFLPWKDIISAQREGRWLWEQVRLTFAKAPDDPVTITGRLADRILSTLGPVWNEPETPKPQKIVA